MISSIPPEKSGCSHLPFLSLQDWAAALFSERIDLLTGEADKQAIFLFMLGDVFDDLGDGLSHGHSLDCSFATQLLRHHPKKYSSFKMIDQLPVALCLRKTIHQSNVMLFSTNKILILETFHDLLEKSRKASFTKKKICGWSYFVSFLTFAAANCWQKYPCVRCLTNLWWRFYIWVLSNENGL